MKVAVIPATTCLMLIMTALGCGKSFDPGAPVKVTGVVTLDGQPLDKATVSFNAISKGLPPKYRFAYTVTDATGNFTIDKVYPADYEVMLSQPFPAGSGAPAVENAAIAGNPKLAKYGVNSPLRANVSKDSTTFKLEAKSTATRSGPPSGPG